MTEPLLISATAASADSYSFDSPRFTAGATSANLLRGDDEKGRHRKHVDCCAEAVEAAIMGNCRIDAHCRLSRDAIDLTGVVGRSLLVTVAILRVSHQAMQNHDDNDLRLI